MVEPLAYKSSPCLLAYLPFPSPSWPCLSSLPLAWYQGKPRTRLSPEANATLAPLNVASLFRTPSLQRCRMLLVFWEFPLAISPQEWVLLVTRLPSLVLVPLNAPISQFAARRTTSTASLRSAALPLTSDSNCSPTGLCLWFLI